MTYLSSHSKENSSDCDSTRCNANEHSVISSVESTVSIASVVVSFGVEVDTVDKATVGSDPSATSLKDRVEQLYKPVLD